ALPAFRNVDEASCFVAQNPGGLKCRRSFQLRCRASGQLLSGLNEAGCFVYVVWSGIRATALRA
ncbi:hypothetical protein, partial [Pontiella sp.]|uniref:hypothetical protein n=1 Tax=Pontiella sp. TaxID=2837462 RepID=UPI0035649069